MGAVLNIQELKMIQQNINACVITRISKKKKKKKNRFDENVKKRFANTYKFSRHDINKFVLLLPKTACPYEYMEDWKNFSEKSLPQKEGFYSHLNTEILLMQIRRT